MMNPGTPSRGLLLSVVLAVASFAPQAFSELQPEPIGSIATLPADYPDHWILVQDASFFHMLEGEILVVDPTAEKLTDQYKGMMTASFLANYVYSAKRNEHYVVEAFFSRGGRGGKRKDFITIYDPATLKVTAEIQIPNKRITSVPRTVIAALSGNERFMGIYNFTPSQSMTIVDMEERRVVTDHPMGGCAFVLATGERNFSSMCQNGTFLTTHLDEEGNVEKTSSTDVVFSSEDDPLFGNPGTHGTTRWFVSFEGRVLDVDLAGEAPAAGEYFWLTTENERNWRPQGLAPLAVDLDGNGYFIMNPEGAEGTHKDGGPEVWVYDLANQKRTKQIKLANYGIAVATAGKGDQQMLLVTNAAMTIDVYSLPSMEHVRTLETGAQTPFLNHAVH